MTFGRWLLVHSLSICILVMFAVGYFFKQELKLNQAYSELLDIDTEALSLNDLGSEKKAPASLATADNDQAQLKQNSNSKHSGALVDVKDAPEMAVADETVEIEVVSTLTAESESTANAEKTSPVFVRPEAIQTKTLPPEEIEKEILAYQNKLQNPTPPAVVKPTAAISAPAEQNLLALAREAYWNHDYKLALDLYQQEIRKHPNTADLYGEMGNIYYGLEQFGLAAQHYFRAGELLLDSNDPQRAKEVYEVLNVFAPEMAEKLLVKKNLQHQ